MPGLVVVENIGSFKGDRLVGGCVASVRHILNPVLFSWGIIMCKMRQLDRQVLNRADSYHTHAEFEDVVVVMGCTVAAKKKEKELEV